MRVRTDRPLKTGRFGDTHGAIPDHGFGQLYAAGYKGAAERPNINDLLMHVQSAGTRRHSPRIILDVGDNLRPPVDNAGRSGIVNLRNDYSVLWDSKDEVSTPSLSRGLAQNVFGDWHVSLVIQTSSHIETAGRQKGIGHSAANSHEVC